MSNIEQENHNIKSELFHAKKTAQRANELLNSTHEKAAKGRFLIEVLRIAYDCNEGLLMGKASEKLLSVIEDL